MTPGPAPAPRAFRAVPQRCPDARIAPPAPVLVNSPGNLGGFVSSTAFGILRDVTGPARGGLVGLPVAGVLAALAVAPARGMSGPVAGVPQPRITDPAVVLCAVAPARVR